MKTQYYRKRKRERGREGEKLSNRSQPLQQDLLGKKAAKSDQTDQNVSGRTLRELPNPVDT
jgi:hypothetical protein